MLFRQKNVLIFRSAWLKSTRNAIWSPTVYLESVPIITAMFRSSGPLCMLRLMGVSASFLYREPTMFIYTNMYLQAHTTCQVLYVQTKSCWTKRHQLVHWPQLVRPQPGMAHLLLHKLLCLNNCPIASYSRPRSLVPQLPKVSATEPVMVHNDINNQNSLLKGFSIFLNLWDGKLFELCIHRLWHLHWFYFAFIDLVLPRELRCELWIRHIWSKNDIYRSYIQCSSQILVLTNSLLHLYSLKRSLSEISPPRFRRRNLRMRTIYYSVHKWFACLLQVFASLSVENSHLAFLPDQSPDTMWWWLVVELWVALVHTSWRRRCPIYLWACSKEILQWALHYYYYKLKSLSLLWSW